MQQSCMVREPGNEATDLVQVLGRSWMKIGPVSTFDLLASGIMHIIKSIAGGGSQCVLSQPSLAPKE